MAAVVATNATTATSADNLDRSFIGLSLLMQNGHCQEHCLVAGRVFTFNSDAALAKVPLACVKNRLGVKWQ